MYNNKQIKNCLGYNTFLFVSVFVFFNFRGADNSGKTFRLNPCLKSEEAELSFLSKVSEALLLVVLPKYYAKCPPIRHLLREVVANRGNVM